MTQTRPLAGPQATQNARAKHEPKWKSEPDDTKVDTYYDRYKCEFLIPESLTSQNLGVPTLTNNIHPLFDEPLRKAVDNYSVVEQSARLASKFIECGTLDHIYLAIANDGSPGRSWRSKGSASKVGLEIPVERLYEKSPADKSKLRQLLETLCRATSFEFEKITEHAVTDTIRDRTFKAPAFPNAERSKVRINKRLYDDLDKAQGTGDTILIAKLQLELAVTLVHEIGHAIDNLAHGKLHHGHFLGKGIVCEPGFDIETRLLGGRLATLYQGLEREQNQRDFADQYYFNEKLSNLRGVLVIWEYPDQGVDYEYSKRKGFKTRENVKNVRHLDLAWRLPMKHVMRLFNDEFWTHEYPANPTALRPRYEVGYTFRL